MVDINVLLAIRNTCKLHRETQRPYNVDGTKLLADSIDAIIAPWIAELDLALEYKDRQDAMFRRMSEAWSLITERARKHKVNIKETPEAAGAEDPACQAEAGGEAASNPAKQEAAAGDASNPSCHAPGELC